MRGDRVEVLVDVGEGVRSFEIAATRDGRRVEITNARGTVEVAEVSRSGRAIRSARFMSTRVVAIVEHPAAEVPPAERTPRRRRDPRSQPALDL